MRADRIQKLVGSACLEERDDCKEPPSNAGSGSATYVGAGALGMCTRGALTSQRQAAPTATLRRNGCIQSYLRKRHVRGTTLARGAHRIAVDWKIVYKELISNRELKKKKRLIASSVYKVADSKHMQASPKGRAQIRILSRSYVKLQPT